jgi:hypothetical protein
MHCWTHQRVIKSARSFCLEAKAHSCWTVEEGDTAVQTTLVREITIKNFHW